MSEACGAGEPYVLDSCGILVTRVFLLLSMQVKFACDALP